MTPEEKLLRMVKLSYCAGLVDGEGCLFVHHNERTQQTLIHLIVCMADFASVSMMADTFGGRVSPFKRQGKLHYRWVLCSDNAALAVREMLPYLKGKREQAELFLGYYEIWRGGRYKHKNRNYDALDLIESKIKELRKVPLADIYPPAETECEDPLEREGCDSPTSSGNEPGELPEMSNHLN